LTYNPIEEKKKQYDMRTTIENLKTEDLPKGVTKEMLFKALGAGAITTGSIFLNATYNLPNYHDQSSIAD